MPVRTPADQDINNWSKLHFSWRPLFTSGIEAPTAFFPSGISFTYDAANPSDANYIVRVPSPGPQYTLANIEHVTAIGAYHGNTVGVGYVMVCPSGNFVVTFPSLLIRNLNSTGTNGAPANIGNNPPNERLTVTIFVKFRDKIPNEPGS